MYKQEDRVSELFAYINVKNKNKKYIKFTCLFFLLSMLKQQQEVGVCQQFAYFHLIIPITCFLKLMFD